VNDSLASKVRALIAAHFGTTLDRLTDETHFRNDLGADRFDRIELMIAIEDRFSGVEIDAARIDDIETVADLMRAIEGQTSAVALEGCAWGAAQLGN
jgi:acyl carrier protein